MWNKSSEAKPSTQGSAAPTPIKPDAKTDIKSDVKPDIKSEIKLESKSEISTQAVAPVAAKTQVSLEQSVSPVSYAAPVAAPAGKPTAAQSAPTTIGTGLKINGELSGNSDLFIDGEAQGKIVLSDSKVTIGAHGRVNADIDAREIIVEGTVQGNLKASEGVHLSASSVVRGTILTPRITIKDGAHLSAKVEMVRPNDQRTHSFSGGSVAVADSEPRRPMAARAESA